VPPGEIVSPLLNPNRGFLLCVRIYLQKMPGFDESIYNLVPIDYQVRTKSPIRIAKGHKSVKVSGSTFGCRGTTRLPGAGEVNKEEGKWFGRNESLARNISAGLQLEQERTRRSTGVFGYTDRRKEKVPDKRERPVMGIKTTKNFITANAVEAILQVPKSVEFGELNYMKKEDFGKVPAYLGEVQEEIRRENEMIDRYVKEQMGHVDEEPDQFDEISNEERHALISALKAKWDSVNKEYQKITHLVSLDTQGKVIRKENFETKMAQLEKDIGQLQSRGPLLVRH
jgi:hypothetical protein